ncbi:hypothetical protein BamMEX5DRAFT_5957 [Burkholderia ambifaria MEX-5]|uniref:Uncharacterized protein n=1 Tax=Burkholderia ambifaria MEX-5 TaxID=396597 RepID=B1TDU1_9BURK|nr:hypothetical protein BamMEX5DRAFT_5957 [Burkholderia ambifaria MEX-5]
MQPRAGGVGQRRRAHAQPLRVGIDEVFDQRRDVAGPLAQRQQAQLHDVEPVVQILAEVARAHRGFEIHVGRRDEPHVDLHGLARADRRHLALLQHAQQLDLRGQRQVAHFIEKQRAAIRGFEPARLAVDRAGERTALVAEQLAFDQCFRKCPAVDSDERPVVALAQRMHEARDQLLAGAALAGDEHRRIARRDELDAFEQHPRFGIVERQCLRANRDRMRSRVRQAEDGHGTTGVLNGEGSTIARRTPATNQFIELSV